MNRALVPVVALLSLSTLPVFAQPASLEFEKVYECPALQARLTVYSCAGTAPSDMCDVHTEGRNQAPMRGKSTHQQVMTLLPLCHPQTQAEAQAAAKGQVAGGVPNRPAAGRGGFKVGDKVSVLTAGPWVNARIVEVRNDGSYMVNVLENGPVVSKSYPGEVRRIGKLTDEDHRNGQYDLHDEVDVNVGGHWLRGQISGYTGNNDFTVRLPDQRTVDAHLQDIRPSHAAAQDGQGGVPSQAVKKGEVPFGQPPKPGLKSCAGKFEGRYASEAGTMGMLTIVFKNGRATVRTPDVVGSPDKGMTAAQSENEAECWTDGEKIVLRWLDKSNFDFPIDVNADGTLDTQFGELRKKSK